MAATPFRERRRIEPSVAGGSPMLVMVLSAGLACLIAAIVGGGLKAFGIEVPALGSVFRQALLGAVGIALLIGAVRPNWWTSPANAPAPAVTSAPAANPTPAANPVQVG